MHPAYLNARLDDIRACDGLGASTAVRDDRSAILGALADLGLPENDYVKDPSRPRSALYLYRDDDGRHELAVVPWRLARNAPPGMLPEDVRRVGRELRCGLLRSVLGLAAACLGALFALLLARTFGPPVAPESVCLAAYLHAAPAILTCVAALCAFAVLWHLVTFLLPSRALAEDEESRSAFADTIGQGGRK